LRLYVHFSCGELIQIESQKAEGDSPRVSTGAGGRTPFYGLPLQYGKFLASKIHRYEAELRAVREQQRADGKMQSSMR
jgi:hypothetical protein